MGSVIISLAVDVAAAVGIASLAFRRESLVVRG